MMCDQDLSKFKLSSNFRGKSVFHVQFWWLIQSTLFACSPQFMYGWRRYLLRLFGAKIGKGVIIRPSARITYPWKLSIGDYSWIGDHVDLYSLGDIRVGKNAVVSQKSYLCTGSHDYQSDSFDIYQKPIVIEDEAWLATDVYIAPGVTIGKGAVIGARSSVFKDMPAGMICVGSPAVPVKKRVP
ncbi:colanic acid biosynthesis acetyltransferase WcaF [Leucothrix arctica]|uniref:Colanic acid biosynthesis acetyltransferase WcaF n=2 Tax=Leucothrix arctica TaxID=1481894 RepID=A0A317CKX0_9GAMM|nr:colanic acid biosynthesis acetyltransferase WcaF [Leucothrix arctica]